jgi:hypothetical protein
MVSSSYTLDLRSQLEFLQSGFEACFTQYERYSHALLDAITGGGNKSSL